MAINWRAEACDLAPDPQSGAAITRLTCAAMHSTNLYFEQPYGTPDGRRIAYARSLQADPRLPPTELCVADLTTLRVASIDSDIVSTWFATSSWSGKLHYVRGNGELIRVDLATLEKEIVMTHWPLPAPVILWSATPDMRVLIAARREGDTTTVYRVDTAARSLHPIYRSTDIIGHMQIDPVGGRDMLIQRNWRQGTRVNSTHFLIDLDGQNERPLKIGEPWTGNSTGHATWVGGTGRIATPLHGPGLFLSRGERLHDARHPQGNYAVVGPDDEQARILAAPEHFFNHAGTSRCGRYFVAESLRNGIPGAVEIVVGNLETGRYRTLVANCGSRCGGAAASHVHAWFTADTRRVIYTADPDGLAQVHAARLPDGFLESLDAPGSEAHAAREHDVEPGRVGA